MRSMYGRRELRGSISTCDDLAYQISLKFNAKLYSADAFAIQWYRMYLVDFILSDASLQFQEDINFVK